MIKEFTEVITDKTGGNKKFKTDEFLSVGLLPIIDQGKDFIAGYTNEEEAKANVKLPCIVFGDHTRIFKYVDFPFALGADGTKVLEVKNGANAKYLYYYFSQVRLAGKGGYDRNYKYLKEISIPLPDLKTQQQIAQTLEQADKARQQRKAANTLTNQFLQSSFLSLFGDPVKNEKGWEQLSGQEYSEKISVGVVIKPASYYVEKGVVALRSLNIRPNKISLQNIVYFSAKDNSEVLSKSILKTDDVVIVRTGATGTAAIVPKELNGCNCIDLIIVRLNRKIINPGYLTFFFNSDFGKSIVLGKQVGGIQKHFNIGAMKELRIPVPPIKLQQKFADIVVEAELLHQKQQQSEMELEHLFQGLLQRYFG